MSIKYIYPLSRFGKIVTYSLLASTELVMAQDQATSEPAANAPVKSSRLSPDELKDKQLDVSLETRDIERVLGKLKKASDLAKQRISEAAVTTESVTSSLNKGDAKVARSDAKQATEKFKEIVKQLEVLLKEEAPQQIAEAKQLARELAKMEREFAEKFDGALNPVQVSSGEGKVDPKTQVAPKTDKDMRGKGEGSKGEGKSNGQGKPETPPKNSKESPDGQGTTPKPDANAGDQAKPNSNSGDKPDGQPKPSDGGTSDETQDADASKQSGGTGEKPKVDKPEGGNTPGKDDGNPVDKSDNDGSGTPAKNNDSSDSEQGSGESENEKPKDGRGSGGKKANRDRPAEKDTKPGAGMSEEQLREAVARQAEKLAQSGKTLQDVLNAIAQSNNPADVEAAGRIQAVIKEFDLNKLVDQMDGVGGMVRSRKDSDVKLSSLDLAERFEIMAQRLDAAYRSIVAPQAEELRKLETQLIELRENLKELETPSQVNTWHREIRDLLDKLDQLGISLEAREQFEKEVKNAGFGPDRDPTRRTVNWGIANDKYIVPETYHAQLGLIQEEIQTRIQALVLGDFGRFADDSTPPMYQELVDRYYQVLSGEQGTANESRETKSTNDHKAK